MVISPINWIIIISYFLISIGIGIYMSKRAGKSTGDFFLSGRKLPWYIAGTSMVATTFAADTPLAVTELVADKGIAGNWLWWNMLFGGMLTVFFFARLWRRADILTDAEFVSIRYSGRAANFLRGFRAVYIGIFMNVIVMAWVNLAMVKILTVLFPDMALFGHNSFLILGVEVSAQTMAVAFLLIFVAIYSALSGLWGVSITDTFQFVMAMTGSIVLAVVALRYIGGVDTLKDKLENSKQIFEYFPLLDKGEDSSSSGILKMSIVALVAYLGVQWWSSWYPGAEPGGGGYVAQRIMSAKNEKHSVLATLWFQIAHYAVRPWPWIIVALASLTIFVKAPDKKQLKNENPYLYAVAEKAALNSAWKKEVIPLLSESGNDIQKLHARNPELVRLINETSARQKTVYKEEYLSSHDFNTYFEKWDNTTDPGKMFPKLMIQDFVPKGLLGLLLAAFLAAFMSTIASQIVWGTSYIINDLFRPFLRTGGSEKYYVKISRITTFLLMLLSVIVTTQLDKISSAWKLVLVLSSGIGLVLILRWFWWRINAWSEISAMLAPYVVFPFLKYRLGWDIIDHDFEQSLIVIVCWSTIVWVVVTFLTRPTHENKLAEFYKKVHPGGIGWRKYRKKLPEVIGDKGLGYMLMNWLLGCVLVMFTLFGVGKLVFHHYTEAVIYFVIALAGAAGIYYNMSKIGWEKMK